MIMKEESELPDQTAQMRSLIRYFAIHICHRIKVKMFPRTATITKHSFLEASEEDEARKNIITNKNVTYETIILVLLV